MTTSIRAIRKQRGLTLQHVADAVGTTPQTIQRLETGNMSVSVDWLERIAIALDLTPAELLAPAARAQRPRVPLAGHVVTGGTIHASHATPAVALAAGGFADGVDTSPPGVSHVTIPAPTEHCIAIHVSAPTGHYAEGTLLIAMRQEGNVAIKQDCDCIIGLVSGELALHHVTVTANGKMTFTAYDPGAGTIVQSRIAWIAPVYMTVREI
jgi:DNA-binding Xre family transcriptional regulator